MAGEHKKFYSNYPIVTNTEITQISYTTVAFTVQTDAAA